MTNEYQQMERDFQIMEEQRALIKLNEELQKKKFKDKEAEKMKSEVRKKLLEIKEMIRVRNEVNKKIVDDLKAS